MPDGRRRRLRRRGGSRRRRGGFDLVHARRRQSDQDGKRPRRTGWADRAGRAPAIGGRRRTGCALRMAVGGERGAVAGRGVHQGTDALPAVDAHQRRRESRVLPRRLPPVPHGRRHEHVFDVRPRARRARHAARGGNHRPQTGGPGGPREPRCRAPPGRGCDGRPIDRSRQHLGAASAAARADGSTSQRSAAADGVRRPDDGRLPARGVLRRRVGCRHRAIADVRRHPRAAGVVGVVGMVAHAFRPRGSRHAHQHHRRSGGRYRQRRGDRPRRRVGARAGRGQGRIFHRSLARRADGSGPGLAVRRRTGPRQVRRGQPHHPGAPGSGRRSARPPPTSWRVPSASTPTAPRRPSGTAPAPRTSTRAAGISRTAPASATRSPANPIGARPAAAARTTASPSIG